MGRPSLRLAQTTAMRRKQTFQVCCRCVFRSAVASPGDNFQLTRNVAGRVDQPIFGMTQQLLNCKDI